VAIAYYTHIVGLLSVCYETSYFHQKQLSDQIGLLL